KNKNAIRISFLFQKRDTEVKFFLMKLTTYMYVVTHLNTYTGCMFRKSSNKLRFPHKQYCDNNSSGVAGKFFWGGHVRHKRSTRTKQAYGSPGAQCWIYKTSTGGENFKKLSSVEGFQ